MCARLSLSRAPPTHLQDAEEARTFLIPFFSILPNTSLCHCETLPRCEEEKLIIGIGTRKERPWKYVGARRAKLRSQCRKDIGHVRTLDETWSIIACQYGKIEGLCVLASIRELANFSLLRSLPIRFRRLGASGPDCSTGLRGGPGQGSSLRCGTSTGRWPRGRTRSITGQVK